MGRTRRLLGAIVGIWLACLVTASSASVDDAGFVETETVESLQAAAAQLQAQAAAQQAVESEQFDASLQQRLADLAAHPEMLELPEAHAFLEHAAHGAEAAAAAGEDAETEAMTHVFSEDQFHDEASGVDLSLLDQAASVDARIEAEIERQVAQRTLDELKQEQRDAAELKEYLAERAGEIPGGAEGDESFLQAGEAQAEHGEQDEVAQAAAEISDAFEGAEDYPVMIESAAQSRQTGKGVPEAVSHAWHSAVRGAKGAFGKLKAHIQRALGREQAVQPQQHSFLASRSHMRAQHRAKEGGQWWLEKAPWFLPPPPEWGPMPVTMYTAYFHRPVHPHHLDYAHGIPLPHAEALNLARRTYPQPPFEVQAAGGGEGESFMEVASEAHAEVDAPLDDESVAAIAAQSAMEDEMLVAEEPMLIQLHAAALAHADADGQSEQEAHAQSDAAVEVDRHPNFIMDPSATTVERLGSEAVEAVEVEDLAHASPLQEEEVLSVPM